MDYEYAVIGGGIIGLATAHALLERRPDATIVLLEKEAAVARHQTGHNSGVIHAGVYYAPGSLKARLCREGNEATKRFCEKNGLAFEVCGKLVVATSLLEVQRLSALRDRCRANQIEVQELTGAQLREIEPDIAGCAALRVPGTGIVDYRAVCSALASHLLRHGTTLRLGFEVRAIHEQTDGVEISSSAGETVRARRLIACAGLQSDRVARLAGLEPEVRIIPFRGEYFRLTASKSRLIKHLIYPVPDPRLPFLGVHLTRMIDGSVTVGPNAVLGMAREKYERWSFDLRDVVETLGYVGLWRMLATNWRSAIAETRSSWFKSSYLDHCRKYCPALEFEDLEPYPAGIRAQAVLRDGTLAQDFLLVQSRRMVHVLNAPSPAATAALPIGRMVADGFGVSD